MATDDDEIQRTKWSLMQMADFTIDGPQLRANANVNQNAGTKDEVAKLSAEVKLLSEKFEEKYAIEKDNSKVMSEIASSLKEHGQVLSEISSSLKQLSRSSLESAPNDSLMQKMEELKKIRDEHIGPLQEKTSLGSIYFKPELELLYKFYHKKLVEVTKLLNDAGK